MEAVIGGAHLGNEFECGVHLVAGPLIGVCAFQPWEEVGLATERIGTDSAERVPVGDGEPEVLLHGLSGHDGVLVVPFEGERVVGFPALELDFIDIREVFFAHDIFTVG